MKGKARRRPLGSLITRSTPSVGKPTYKGKDVTEGRRLHRTRAPDTVGPEARQPTSLQGIADKAKADKQHRFRDLYGCLNVELLLDCWGDLNKDAASGVDGVTWQAYGGNLQANVEALVERLKQKRYRAKLIRRRVHSQGKRPREAVRHPGDRG